LFYCSREHRDIQSFPTRRSSDLSHTVTIRAHNVSTGMTDYKNPWSQLGVIAQAVTMINNTNRVLSALKVNPERALEELENDWTRSEEHTSELQSRENLVCRLLLE